MLARRMLGASRVGSFLTSSRKGSGAGSSGFEVVWEMISDPGEVHRRVLPAVENERIFVLARAPSQERAIAMR